MSDLSLLAFDELPRGVGGVGATEKIARALTDSGIDAPSSLYDEALALARQGRLAPATERLRMLLVLDTTDAQAALLLGKVLAGRGLWQESLAQLDNAAANGAVLPPGLREQVETKLRKHIEDAEAHRARIAARERGEIKSLRTEAKRLRSDNAALEQQVDDLSDRVRIWSSATALIAGSACALLLVSLLFGGGEETAPEATAEAPEALEVETALASTAGTVTEPVGTGIVAPSSTTSTPVLAPTGTTSGSTTSTTRTPPSTAKTRVDAKPPVVAPVSKAAPRTHVVAKGDTLGKLASKYYGKSSLWPEIQEANRGLLGSSEALSIGMELTIPEL